MLGVQMTMSIRLRSRAMASSAVLTLEASAMSSMAASAPGMRAATACAAASLASSTTTPAPCVAAPIATASPMPDPPPMTAAVLPLRSNNPFGFMGPQPGDENGQKSTRRGDQPGEDRRQAQQPAAAGREVHGDHRRNTAGDRCQRFGRAGAPHVQSGQNRHEERDHEQAVEHADDADDSRR